MTRLTKKGPPDLGGDEPVRTLFQRVVRWVLAIMGFSAGPALVMLVFIQLRDADIWNFQTLQPWVIALVIIGSSAVTGVAALLLTPGMLRKMESLEHRLLRTPLPDILAAVVGLIVGLLVAYLLSRLTAMIGQSWLALLLSTLLYIILGYSGLSLGLSHREDLMALFTQPWRGRRSRAGGDEGKRGGVPKVLDTSVIIDGRILEVARTGFLEGPLWVPQFVLAELRYIADSADALRRNRGRRGLDVLNEMQKELSVAVDVITTDYEDEPDVDQKLLRLAMDSDGWVITNDFNLSKVAVVQGVKVLNINDLANAVKPVALPGEEMIIQIIKEGKEQGQGVGFLDDGTMVVVENGNRLMGRTIPVTVTSALQTSAGRMIFGKPRE